jgi:ketosteroid isomerase-like protein
LFADDALISGVFGSAPLEQALPVFRELHEALAMSLTVEGLVAEGDTVVARYVERGISQGPFRGQPATGRTYELDAMEWFTLAAGRITRRWGARDSAAQARQLGWVTDAIAQSWKAVSGMDYSAYNGVKLCEVGEGEQPDSDGQMND